MSSMGSDRLDTVKTAASRELGRRTAKELWTYNGSTWTQTKDIRFIVSVAFGAFRRVRNGSQYGWRRRSCLS